MVHDYVLQADSGRARGGGQSGRCFLAGHFGRVLLPLVSPGLFTTAIIVFVDAWHEFLFALTINTKQSMMTVPVGIAMFQGSLRFLGEKYRRQP